MSKFTAAFEDGNKNYMPKLDGGSKVFNCDKRITDAIFQIEFCSSLRQSNFSILYYTVSSVFVGKLNCLLLNKDFLWTG